MIDVNLPLATSQVRHRRTNSILKSNFMSTCNDSTETSPIASQERENYSNDSELSKTLTLAFVFSKKQIAKGQTTPSRIPASSAVQKIAWMLNIYDFF